jgi:hypothetical protein
MSFTQSPNDAIGTKSEAGVITPATLTALASGNASIVYDIENADSMSVKVRYTPLAGQTNRYAKLYILESDDNVNWFSRAIRVTGVDVSDIYTIDPDLAVGIYEKIPNGAISTGGTLYPVCYNVELSGSKYLKVQACEDGVANFGTLYVGLTFINKSL